MAAWVVRGLAAWVVTGGVVMGGVVAVVTGGVVMGAVAGGAAAGREVAGRLVVGCGQAGRQHDQLTSKRQCLSSILDLHLELQMQLGWAASRCDTHSSPCPCTHLAGVVAEEAVG